MVRSSLLKLYENKNLPIQPVLRIEAERVVRSKIPLNLVVNTLKINLGVFFFFLF